MSDNKEVTITEPSMLIRVNVLFREDMSKKELYDATRSSWIVNPKRANKVKYVFSVYQGIIREIYRVDSWAPVTSGEKEVRQNRHEFTGQVAEPDVRNKYLNKSVKHYFKRGNCAPCNYVNVEARL